MDDVTIVRSRITRGKLSWGREAVWIMSGMARGGNTGGIRIRGQMFRSAGLQALRMGLEAPTGAELRPGGACGGRPRDRGRQPHAHRSASDHFLIGAFGDPAAGTVGAAKVQTFAVSFVGSTVTGFRLFFVSTSLNAFRSSDCTVFHAASVVL